jgi:hypothetical protein
MFKTSPSNQAVGLVTSISLLRAMLAVNVNAAFTEAASKEQEHSPVKLKAVVSGNVILK